MLRVAAVSHGEQRRTAIAHDIHGQQLVVAAEPHADDAGVWDGFVPSATLGDRYKFRIRAYVASNSYSIGSSSPWLTFMFT